MRQLVCGQAKLVTDYGTGGMVLQLPVLAESKAEAQAIVNEGNEKNSVEIKKYRKARSLDANAYMWKLIGELAEKLNVGRDEIYRNAIKDIGGNHDIVCATIEAAQKFSEIWRSRGLGWVTQEMPSKIDGCVNLVLFYGSSVYDTKQMSQLIDHVVQDCKAVGIDTRTPNEIANMLSQWEEHENDKKKL